MDFWNDYEGQIIEGDYPLERLLHPEGRSGFFSTSNGTGTPAVIRVTETLNDQEEILGQWRMVQELNHPNLIRIKTYGPTSLDGTPLIYAVMQAPDADLAAILRERPMNAEETTQIATSLISALKALHDKGLIHGHLEPANVYAVGEVVQLRSDCVRKVANGVEGNKLKALEVQDLALLLLESLTQQRRRSGNPKITLPAPFEEIVSNGMAGTWGLDEISSALKPGGSQSHIQPSSSPLPEPRQVDVRPIAPPQVPEPAVYDQETPLQEEMQFESPIGVGETGERWPRPAGPWIVAGVVLLAVILGSVYFFRGHSTAAPPNAQSAPTTLSNATPNKPSAVVGAVAPQPHDQTKAASPVLANPSTMTSASAAQNGKIWRVVAYTYNREDQARNKVTSLTRTHNSLKPEVFSPTGHAPYLISLGGDMDHDEAMALLRKVRGKGFPRDTYMQNYASR